MITVPVIGIKPLGFQWETSNPFLFCVHHRDVYPKGNDRMGPDASLDGRNIGNDFVVKEGWRMYHGNRIPGFPVHPHRGFETVTIVLEGFVDHSDSMGGAGRYGQGDVQWMTAGAGIQHSEMFPLLNTKGDNRLELFQIWLNLPAGKKYVEPHYRMFWSEDIPKAEFTDIQGKKTIISIIAGEAEEKQALLPPPDSWASEKRNDVNIWLLKMEPGASWKIPGTNDKVSRALYFYEGKSLLINGEQIPEYHSIQLRGDSPVALRNGNSFAELLFLQGLPIDEPVVQYGPFVMNTQQEIQDTIRDYRRTEFGGWPWPERDQVFDRSRGRFARYAGGEEVLR
jgi:redox-sensitive bicupin YhaK (pirin superfamily)